MTRTNFRRLLTLFILLICAVTVKASHIYGGDLLYEHVSGNTYKVILTIYGDCSGTTAFPSLGTNARPQLTVYDGFVPVQEHFMVRQEGSGEEVSPVCEKEKENTTCNGGTLPGIARFIYTADVTLSGQSANWRFVYAGEMGGGNPAGRSNSISNIMITGTGTSDLFCLVATLNNMNGNNSSPKYTTIPTPFFCINKSQQYNQGAIDPDSDSLTFSLTAALNGNQASCTYVPPYTPAAPLATNAGSFAFNPDNGQLSFNPNAAQTSVVVNKVEEYKNGVLIGSSMREMTFIVLSNCSNTPPSASFNDTMTGVANAGNNTVNACEGTEKIAFKLTASDPDGDNITVTASNLPDGAGVTVKNNGTSNPTIDFAWSTTALPVGTYNVFINFKDNGCPISSNQTIAYTIKVIKNFGVTHTVIDYTNCSALLQTTQFNIAEGVTPYRATLYQGFDTLRTYDDTTSRVIQDRLRPGTYHLVVSSKILPCATDYQLTVIDTGIYPLLPEFTNPDVCLYDSVMPVDISKRNIGDIKWYDMDGNLLDGNPVYTTQVVGKQSWLVSQTYKVCESDKDTFTVTVHDLPSIRVVNEPTKVCIGDVVYLQADGAETYQWTPSEKVFIDKNKSPFTKVMSPTTYTVVGADAYGCKDTADVTYSDIENCCTLSFPTAFTPNNDHKNDGFRVILYGNEENYALSIFNRWGQCVFTTNNPKQYWDGNFGGKPCEVGTYYYRVNGKCLTGQMVDQTGDFVLIR